MRPEPDTPGWPTPTPERLDLLRRLGVFNRVLGRLGATPIITPTEAADLPSDNLAAAVALTADRVVTVARALDGIP